MKALDLTIIREELALLETTSSDFAKAMVLGRIHRLIIDAIRNLKDDAEIKKFLDEVREKYHIEVDEVFAALKALSVRDDDVIDATMFEVLRSAMHDVDKNVGKIIGRYDMLSDLILYGFEKNKGKEKGDE